MTRPPSAISSTNPARKVAAVVLTVVVTFHWLPAYWIHHLRDLGLFADVPGVWQHQLLLLTLALALTVWSPRTFGLAWAQTWEMRKIVAIVGGGMTAVAILGMLFIHVPLYGGGAFIFLTTPLTEELLFRGLVFTVLNDAFPRRVRIRGIDLAGATLLSAVAFGLWHLGGPRAPANGFVAFQVFYTMIAGILFAHMRDVTGSIAAPWLVHFTVNLWAARVPGFWAMS